jgi:hypothetical protein
MSRAERRRLRRATPPAMHASIEWDLAVCHTLDAAGPKGNCSGAQAAAVLRRLVRIADAARLRFRRNYAYLRSPAVRTKRLPFLDAGLAFVAGMIHRNRQYQHYGGDCKKEPYLPIARVRSTTESERAWRRRNQESRFVSVPSVFSVVDLPHSAWGAATASLLCRASAPAPFQSGCRSRPAQSRRCAGCCGSRLSAPIRYRGSLRS